MNTKQINQRQQIENTFQNYCQVFLYKCGDYYSVPEWDIYYQWGEKLFTLEELYQILMGYKALEAVFYGIQIMSNLQNIDRSLIH